jgi:NifU-like protein involved in Fe-S cluster formation
MDAPLYNAEILRLAASIPHQARLDNPQATAERRSPVCGSRVRADVRLDEEGRVSAFGQEVRACALGQASAAILGAGVLGRTADELAAAAAALTAWLAGGDWPAEALDRHFPRTALFGPARAHPARHASIRLPFEAAAAATADARTPAPAG